jgi:hypothetical protein
VKENSRKDIQKVDKLIKKCDECKLNECINCEISWTEVVSIKKITDEYKKVLKMNEVLLKENEELKSDNLEYQRIQDIFDKRTYRKKYLEERRKEEPNLLYPDTDEIYRRYYELQKENQQLRNEYRNIQQDGYIRGRAEEQQKAEQIIYENYISKQKIKNKIERIQEEGYWLFTTDRDSDKCVEVLQQLLEKE